MNQKDRKILIHAINALRSISPPANPADIKEHVINLKRAASISKSVANAIESCRYGDYDIAEEDIEGFK